MSQEQMNKINAVLATIANLQNFGISADLFPFFGSQSVTSFIGLNLNQDEIKYIQNVSNQSRTN